MGSPCEVLAAADSDSEAAKFAGLVAEEVWRIEDKFSRYLEGNVIDRINSAKGHRVKVDEECGQLIDFASTLHSLSDGLFDITSGILRRVWQFDGGSSVPAEAAVSDLLPLIGWQKASWTKPTLCLPVGMEIDLGGIGKEYAVDRCVSLLRQLTSTPCLVNLGGDLAVTGPRDGDAAWSVGIEAINGSSHESVIEIRRGGIATSGDSRRYVEKHGVRYSHVLNARTGWPVDHAPSSVTVAADTCVQAGMLSTLAMLRGSGAEEFLTHQSEASWCRR